MKTKKLVSGLLVVTLLTAATFSSCGGGDAPAVNTAIAEQSEAIGENGNAREKMTIAINTDVTNLDPQNHSGSINFLIDTQIYDNLIVLNDKTKEFENRLAEKVEFSDDGLQATITLKQGAMFTNGDPVKASDVKFSFERALNSPIISGRVDVVSSCDVIDDKTVVIHFKHAYALREQILSNVYIVSEKAVTAAGENYGQDASTVVGSGPFKVDSWDKGSKIVLSRNEEYFGDVAKMKTLEFRIIVDETTATMALEKGEVDYLWSFLQEETLNSLRQSENVAILEGTQFLNNYLIMNNTKAPFNDPNVRMAIAYAIDREGATFVSMGEVGEAIYTFLAPGTTGNAEDVLVPSQDIEKAKEYMAKSAYPEGFSCKFSVAQGEDEKNAPIFQSNLAEIGIDVEIETLEFNTLLDKQLSLDYDLSYQGWYNGGDADWMYRYYLSTSESNMFGYYNTDLDALLEAGRRETDTAKREEIYREAQLILQRDMPVIPISTNATYAACNKALKDVLMPVFMIYPLNHVSW